MTVSAPPSKLWLLAGAGGAALVLGGLALLPAGLTAGCTSKGAAEGRAQAAAMPSASGAAVPSSMSRPSGVDVDVERDGRLDELWKRAEGAEPGEQDDLARLADREGSAGLEEKGTGSRRLTAARAMAFADGFGGLPWLADLADGTDDGLANAALDSLAEIAARPRRWVDPEDALEVREGCDRLLALARNTGKPRPRRIGAIRALRMLTDVGCAKLSDVPELK